MPPPLHSVVETGIYADDLDAAERFYGEILGLRQIGKEPGHHVFFQVGEANVLLAFLPEATRRGDVLPAHGTTGAGHFALGIAAKDLESWRKHLLAHGIPIELEVKWPREGKSIYFRDPAGNAIELVTPSLWGLPTGW